MSLKITVELKKIWKTFRIKLMKYIFLIPLFQKTIISLEVMYLFIT